VQVKKLFFNGAGEEVGRLFEHDSQWIGIVGDNFESFEHMAERLHQSQPLRDLTAVMFIRETAFDWMEGKHKNARWETLTEYILKRAEEEVKDFDIWVPLHRTYLESSFQMGRVILRTITREMMDEAEARMPASNDPETAAAFELHLRETGLAYKAPRQQRSRFGLKKQKLWRSRGSKRRPRRHFFVFFRLRIGLQS
jgi:hypothetical protein